MPTTKCFVNNYNLQYSLNIFQYFYTNARSRFWGINVIPQFLEKKIPTIMQSRNPHIGIT